MFKLHLLPSRKKLSVHVSPLFELMLICEGLRNVRRLAKSQKLRKDLIWRFEQHWEFNIGAKPEDTLKAGPQAEAMLS